MQTEKLLYSVEDVVAVTGIGRTKVFAFMKSGALKAVKVGKRTHFKPSDLKAFIDSLEERAVA